MTGRQKKAWNWRPRADKRQPVGCGGAKAGPGANHRQVAKSRYVLNRSSQHSAQDGVIHGRVLSSELPGGSNEDLACRARLHVESDRLRRGSVGALQVSQLDQLAP